MKKLLKEYIRYIIKEHGLLDKYAFADERDNVPSEPNNYTEESLLRDILAYLNGNFQIQQNSVEMIKGFLNSSEYSDIFVKPDVDAVYRGLFMNPESASKIIGITPDKFKVKMGKHDGVITLHPRDGVVSSWSKNFSTALNFGRNELIKNGSEEDIIFLFKAVVSDNEGSMLDLRELYKLNNRILKAASNEEEVFCFGPVRINQVKWYQKF